MANTLLTTWWTILFRLSCKSILEKQKKWNLLVLHRWWLATTHVTNFWTYLVKLTNTKPLRLLLANVNIRGSHKSSAGKTGVLHLQFTQYTYIKHLRYCSDIRNYSMMFPLVMSFKKKKKILKINFGDVCVACQWSRSILATHLFSMGTVRWGLGGDSYTELQNSA